jgi:predicted TIM-barrel fold metal-dependent hydrolase
MNAKLSPAARALVARAFADLGTASAVDHHAHIVGLGTGATQAEVNPALLSWWHPADRIRTSVFLSACGLGDLRRADADYVERLVRLAREFGHPLKVYILALDHYYNSDGTINLKKTQFYVPNAYVVRLAEKWPDIFVPVISVHPARPEALTELDHWAQRGVRFVKWLPNAQGIDAADPRHDEFYRRLRRRDMILLTHTGKESSVAATGGQELGNPLRFRRALDLGVKVIMAHAASQGRSADLDRPGTTADSFELFLRLMADERYRGLLFGDISAITQVNRRPECLLALLRRSDLHDRLVNGSDYPLPAINCVIWTSLLARRGQITRAEQRCLNEIYAYNPLCFDFVLKRIVSDPSTGARFPARLFLANPCLTGAPVPAAARQ